MKRRRFLALLGSSIAAPPLASHAQQQSTPVIGFLNTQDAKAFSVFVDGFRRGLQETGFSEGRNLGIEFRWAEGRYERLPALAAELVARNVSVLVSTGGEPAALAAKAATSTTPIVFLIAGDPVRLGLTSAFNRPGGNATGAVLLTTALEPKRIGLLRDMLPNSRRLALLANPTFPDSELRQRQTIEAARSNGQEIVVVTASTEGDIDKRFAELAGLRPDAMLVAADPFFNSRRNQIVALAARYGLPAMYEWREFVTAGGLMSYGTQLPDSFRMVGQYTGRILKGEKPSEMPVLQPTKFELVVNMKTARALGLSVPVTLLGQADDVIE